MSPFKLRVVVLFLLLTAGAYSQSLQFFREKIELFVHETHSRVKGTYYFKNTGERLVSKTLYYPFPVRPSLPYPENVSVLDSLKNKKISCEHQNSGIIFRIDVPAKSVVIYVVEYTQRTPKQKMEYILTTTGEWGRSLELAEYVVVLPRALQLIRHSLDFNVVKKFSDKVVYYSRKTNFRPAENLIIQWAEGRK